MRSDKRRCLRARSPGSTPDPFDPPPPLPASHRSFGAPRQPARNFRLPKTVNPVGSRVARMRASGSGGADPSGSGRRALSNGRAISNEKGHGRLPRATPFSICREREPLLIKQSENCLVSREIICVGVAGARAEFALRISLKPIVRAFLHENKRKTEASSDN